MTCMTCGKKQNKLVLFCPACIKKDIAKMNAKRKKKGLSLFK